MATKPRAPVIPLFRRVTEDEEEEAVLASPPRPTSITTAFQGQAIDLEGRAPAWFLIGPNYSGKTTFARWVGWTSHEGGRYPLLAALDPTNRTLTLFFDNVAQPPSADATQTAAWLREMVRHLMREKSSALLDMGGGDTALGKVVESAPSLATEMQDAGVAPVAAYFLGPRIDDLSGLESFEKAGFQPAATALILNHARVDVGLDPTEAFTSIRRHSVFRSAVDRGAIVLEMPRLDPPELALEIERKRLSFGHAMAGTVPDGRKVAPITGLDRVSVRTWLSRMKFAFEPVRQWLP